MDDEVSMRTMTQIAPPAWMALSLGVAALVAPARAHACSCAVPEPRAAHAAAAAVFEGVVVRHVTAHGGQHAVATFRVERVWRGAVGRTFTVRTHGVTTMCPPHFEVGQRYIVYVDGPADDPRVRACSRYAAGALLEPERAALGPPTRSFSAP